MKIHSALLVLVAGFGLATATVAQVPADAPAGTTGVCKDGTYSSAASKKGACRGHKGVKDWYAAASGAATAPGGTAAAAPVAAAAPGGATGVCKDGTYSTSATRKGACRGHKGVKDWYATGTGSAAAASAGVAAPVTAAATPASAAVKPAPAAAAGTSPPSAAKPSTNEPAATAAPGGGAGLVWVNSSTKVYHCEGDRWYGKTKQGQYMSEAAAKAQGDRADHGKACQ